MELRVQVPFEQLLTAVKSLTPSQRAKLRKELDSTTKPKAAERDDFVDFLLQGPIYSEKDIAVIEENRKSIAAWRTRL